MNSPKIKAVIVKNGDTQEALAEYLGIGLSALNARINGHVEFRRSEINAIRDHYKLTPEETMDIFFDEDVS